MARDRRNRYGMKKGAEQLQQLQLLEDEKTTTKEEHERIRSLIEEVMNDLNEMDEFFSRGIRFCFSNVKFTRLFEWARNDPYQKSFSKIWLESNALGTNHKH